MTGPTGPNRRAVLRAGGAAAVAGLPSTAGCSSAGDSSTITIATAPTPPTSLQANYLREQTDIYQGVYEN